MTPKGKIRKINQKGHVWSVGLGRMAELLAHADGEGLEGCGKPGGSGEERPDTGKEQPSRFLRPDWKEFPTQPPVCSRDDGFSAKLDDITFLSEEQKSIKGYGNAIVPQVVYEIFKAIEETYKSDSHE